jgi:hypothetical protein
MHIQCNRDKCVESVKLDSIASDVNKVEKEANQEHKLDYYEGAYYKCCSHLEVVAPLVTSEPTSEVRTTRYFDAINDFLIVVVKHSVVDSHKNRWQIAQKCPFCTVSSGVLVVELLHRYGPVANTSYGDLEPQKTVKVLPKLIAKS